MDRSLIAEQLASIIEDNGVEFTFTPLDGADAITFMAIPEDMKPDDVRYGVLSLEEGDSIVILTASRSALVTAGYTPAKGHSLVDEEGSSYRVAHIGPKFGAPGMLELACVVVRA